jgi:hypothetical protein
MYLAIAVLGYAVRRYGKTQSKRHDQLRAKIDQLDIRISASMNGNASSQPAQSHPSPSGSVADEEAGPGKPADV